MDLSFIKYSTIIDLGTSVVVLGGNTEDTRYLVLELGPPPGDPFDLLLKLLALLLVAQQVLAKRLHDLAVLNPHVVVYSVKVLDFVLRLPNLGLR